MGLRDMPILSERPRINWRVAAAVAVWLLAAAIVGYLVGR